MIEERIMTGTEPTVRRVNIHPDDIEITNPRWLDGKFILTFVVWKSGKITKYNIHLDFFWLGLIVDSIRDVLRHVDDAVRTVKSNLRNAGI